MEYTYMICIDIYKLSVLGSENCIMVMEINIDIPTEYKNTFQTKTHQNY